MNENVVPLNLTAQDEADLEALDHDFETEEGPSYHPVLEVWQAVLKPASDPAEYESKPTPAWANRIVSGYHGLTYADLNAVRDGYYGFIQELAAILDQEIASDPKCLKQLTSAEDAENNAEHYKNLLLLWQMAFQQRELDWDCTADDAAVQIAVLAEVHKMFFGQVGITAYLDNIQFEFTEADQEQLAEALSEMREGQ